MNLTGSTYKLAVKTWIFSSWVWCPFRQHSSREPAPSSHLISSVRAPHDTCVTHPGTMGLASHSNQPKHTARPIVCDSCARAARIGWPIVTTRLRLVLHLFVPHPNIIKLCQIRFTSLTIFFDPKLNEYFLMN